MIAQENICFFEELEIEELILYPRVKRKINKHRLKYYQIEFLFERACFEFVNLTGKYIEEQKREKLKKDAGHIFSIPFQNKTKSVNANLNINLTICFQKKSYQSRKAALKLKRNPL